MAIGTSKLLVADKIRKATDIISGQYQKQMKKEVLLGGIGSIGSALALMLMPGVKEAGAFAPALKGILQKPIERNIMALLRKFGMGADLSALKTVDGWGGDAIKRIKESYSDFMAESEDWKGNLMKNVALQYASAFAGGKLEKPFGKLKGSISDKLSEAISKVKGVKPLAPTAAPQFQVPETSITGKLGTSYSPDNILKGKIGLGKSGSLSLQNPNLLNTGSFTQAPGMTAYGSQAAGIGIGGGGYGSQQVSMAEALGFKPAPFAIQGQQDLLSQLIKSLGQR